jgi:hypothetical protein
MVQFLFELSQALTRKVNTLLHGSLLFATARFRSRYAARLSGKLAKTEGLGCVPQSDAVN